MNVPETLISALTSDPSIRLLRHEADHSLLRLITGPIEVMAAWNDVGDTVLSARLPIVLPAGVHLLPEWQRQLDRMLDIVEAERPALVTCTVVSEEPWTVEVAVRVLADALDRHHLLAAVDEIAKVQRLLARRLDALSSMAVQTSEMVSRLEAVTTGSPIAGSPSAPPASFAPPRVRA